MACDNDDIILPFKGEIQQKQNWCWVAVVTGVFNYYSCNTKLSQTEVAASVLSLGLSADYSEKRVDKQKSLVNPLQRLGIWVYKCNGPVRSQNIVEQLRMGRILCVRVRFPNGSGHFAVIHGITKDKKMEKVHLHDPMTGYVTYDYNCFFNDSAQGTVWSHTYYTNKN